jgi:lipopolysaccharide export LptBFGC system permease protein LptF
VDRFVVQRFMEPFVLSLGALTTIYMLGDFIERFDELVKNKPVGWLGLEYFVLRLPLVVSQLLPIACLTGVLPAFALLNRSEWRLNHVRHLHIDDRGVVTRLSEPSFQIGFEPADFILARHNSEGFSLRELNHYIRSLRRKGLAPGGYVVDRDLNHSTPLACLIMADLGVSLSIHPLPRQLNFGRSFGLGLVIGFGYWVALGFTSSIGRSEVISAWLPNTAFAILAVSIFLFGEEH